MLERLKTASSASAAIATIITFASLVLSVSYEVGVYSALGYGYISTLMISDYLKLTLTWMPVLIFSMALGSISIAFIFYLTNKDIIKKYDITVIFYLYNYRNFLIGVILLMLAVLLILLYVTTTSAVKGDIELLLLFFPLFAIFILSYLYLTRRIEIIATASFASLIALLFAFVGGYSNAKITMRSDDFRSTVLYSNGKSLTIKTLVLSDAGLLHQLPDRRVVFSPWSAITAVSTE